MLFGVAMCVVGALMLIVSALFVQNYRGVWDWYYARIPRFGPPLGGHRAQSAFQRRLGAVLCAAIGVGWLFGGISRL